MIAVLNRLFGATEKWEPCVATGVVKLESGITLDGPLMKKSSPMGVVYREMTSDEYTDYLYWQAIK
ncbi:hypothetical protein [Rhizobium tumorigenes]|uniref:hypothetical protein n=1 Tax=Rhizobium tumorigenes TaxID=2041385 RepID=UPI002420376F|nr:hypothetical protein [Rhizobium tumorigenes]WFR99903.1 hypothetical protein PR016_12155 [Rhizobium tumorigenes]